MAVDGHIQDWHIAHHSRFALGGMALSFVEATGVTPEGRITYGCTGIWDDNHVLGLKKIVNLYKSQNIAVGIQLGHAGRRASCVRLLDGGQSISDKDTVEPPWGIIGPSAIAEREGYPVPRSMSHKKIMKVIEAFKAAAKRALDAGFDTIEIHGAHGYLIHSFFSPISNQRKDQYGGNLRRRMTFPLMVTEAIREIWPEIPYISKEIDDQLEINAHYRGYLKKQNADILAFKRDENLKIPQNVNYDDLSGLSNEVKSKFKQIRPKTMGQALRIDGITPAAAYILLSHLKRKSIKHIA